MKQVEWKVKKGQVFFVPQVVIFVMMIELFLMVFLHRYFWYLRQEKSMYHTRLASIGTNTLNYVTKYGFLLAEERKKWKTFFSHMAGSMGLSVQGVFRSHGVL